MGLATRILASLIGGFTVALSLLWVMQWMLSNDNTIQKAERTAPVMEFVRLKRESETRLTERERREPEPPPQDEQPPQPPEIEVDTAAPQRIAPQIAFAVPELSMAMSGPYIGPVRQGPADRDFMAISRMPPQYPYRAKRKGIEGWVKVSFLITEQGSVQDVILIDSEPKNVFDQAATRAVQKWKFKPRIENGKPVAVRAQQTVNFRLNEEAR